MSDSVDADELDRSNEENERSGVETVEAYEVDGGVVLYDAENPLAWVEATVAVTLSEVA